MDTNRESVPPASAPAPWRLQGEGFILAYWFPRERGLALGLVPDGWQDRYRGGPGAVMVVDYRCSNVGPYQELLVVPGRFRVGRRLRPAITRIYVSTQASVDNGRANWAIPKEIADFHFAAAERGARRVTVTREGRPVADLTLDPSRVSVPVTMALVPRPWRTLAQPHAEGFLETTLSGMGWAGPARVRHAWFDGTSFPDVTRLRLLAAVHAEGFQLTFPVAVATAGGS
jgi:hypothetical protein